MGLRSAASMLWSRLWGGRRRLVPSSRREARRSVRAGIYDAAESSDKHWWSADGTSANAALTSETRRVLRDRVRYECANNGYAAGLIEKMTADMIGTGPRLQLVLAGVPQEVPRVIERAWRRWARRVNLLDDLMVLHATKLRDGEAFALMVSDPSITDTVSLDLVLYEADQVTDPWDYGRDPLYVDGIRRDEVGNPVSYTFLQHHPGSMMIAPTYDTQVYPASQVIHWYTPQRPGQARGVSQLASVLQLFAQLRRYTLAVLTAAETAALLAGVLKTPAPVGSIPNESERELDAIALPRGALLTLPAGTEAEQFEPRQPATTYAEFKHELLTEIGSGVGVPFNVVAGNSSGYNYSSARLDHLNYHRMLKVERSRFAQRVLDRIFREWVQEAALVGEIPPALPPLDEWEWTWYWDGHESIDPVKDATAVATELAANTRTLAEVYASRGQDWEEQIRQRGRELAMMAELGLGTPGGSPVPVTEDGESGAAQE